MKFILNIRMSDLTWSFSPKAYSRPHLFAYSNVYCL